MQAGYRAVIAPGKGEGFADIFEANAFNNGLLVIELDPDDWQAIAAAGRDHPGQAEVTIDLRDQTITLENPRRAPPRGRPPSASPSRSPNPTAIACSTASTRSPRPCSTTLRSAGTNNSSRPGSRQPILDFRFWIFD